MTITNNLKIFKFEIFIIFREKKNKKNIYIYISNFPQDRIKKKKNSKSPKVDISHFQFPPRGLSISTNPIKRGEERNVKYRKYSNDEERSSGCNANFLIEIILRGHSKLATPRNVYPNDEDCWTSEATPEWERRRGEKGETTVGPRY